MVSNMIIIVETYSYGVKQTSRYPSMKNFESNVFMHENYVVCDDDTLINAKEIKAAYPAKENKNDNT